MASNYWWQREDLCYKNDQLFFAEQNVSELALKAEIPTFYYSSARIKANIHRVMNALKSNGFDQRCKMYYAMKANRFASVLKFIKSEQLSGIDACSPQEVEHAIACGFKASEISFTACSLSKKDLNMLCHHDQLLMNCDSLHSIKSWGALKPNTEIGIRINPAIGTSRSNNDKLQYAGDRITKFGIYKEQLDEALELAAQYGLKVTRIHFHTGCGYLNAELTQWKKVLQETLWFLNRCPDLTSVNIGGGLGVPHVETDLSLDLDEWAQTLYSVFGHLPIDIAVEPGDYIVKDAGILILEKTFQEIKKNKLFVGVNGGFNLAPEPAYYSMPFEPVAITHYDQKITASIAGNINEALDVWYHDFEISDLSQQSHIVIINSGAYSSSMSSNHCMRGEFEEYLINCED